MNILEGRYGKAELDEETKQWLLIRKREALKIDPDDAEVIWVHSLTFDPYGVHPDLPEELHQVGREFFARAPGSEVWVWFGDLPRGTEKSLIDKHLSSLYLTI